MRLFLMFVVMACVLIPVGCGPNAAETTAPVRVPPLDLHWPVLLRDHATATAYAGKKIRVRLDKDDYACEVVNGCCEVRVWASHRNCTPAVVFLCEMPPDGHIVVVGTCREPVRDGKWRSPRVDYCITVENCSWYTR